MKLTYRKYTVTRVENCTHDTKHVVLEPVHSTHLVVPPGQYMVQTRYKTYIYKLCLSVCRFVCPFLSNKRQDGWTDQVQFLCGTLDDPRKGLWKIKIGSEKILENSWNSKSKIRQNLKMILNGPLWEQHFKAKVLVLINLTIYLVWIFISLVWTLVSSPQLTYGLVLVLILLLLVYRLCRVSQVKNRNPVLFLIFFSTDITLFKIF